MSLFVRCFRQSNPKVVFLSNRFYYTIVSPKVLRPNSEYHVAVSTQGTTQPTTVVVDVGGKQDSGGVLKVTQFVKVDPFATRIVRLEVSCQKNPNRRPTDGGSRCGQCGTVLRTTGAHLQLPDVSDKKINRTIFFY